MTRPKGSRQTQESLAILFLTFVQIMHIVDAMLIMPLGPQFMRIWAITPTQFGLMVSAYTSCAAISALSCALFINRYDRRSSLIFLYVGFTVSLIFCLMAHDYTSLLFARGLAGLFGGVINAVVFAIVADLIPETRRGTALGKVGIAFPISSVAGVPIGLFLANQYDWHAPYLILLFLSIIGGTFIFTCIPSLGEHVKKAREEKIFKQSLLILREKNHRRALMLIGILFLGGFSVIPFISPYMVANVGLSETDLPLIYLFGGLATLFTSRYIGKLSDRYGKSKMFTIIAMISVIPVIALTNLPEAPVWVAITTSTFFMIFVSGRFIPAMAIVSSASSSEVRGSFMSFNTAAQQISMSIASLTSSSIIGFTSDGALTNYGLVGLLSATCALIGVVVANTVNKTN